MSISPMALQAVIDLFVTEEIDVFIVGGEIGGLIVCDNLIILRDTKCDLCHKELKTFKLLAPKYCFSCAPICGKCGSKCYNGIFDSNKCQECFTDE